MDEKLSRAESREVRGIVKRIRKLAAKHEQRLGASAFNEIETAADALVSVLDQPEPKRSEAEARYEVLKKLEEQHLAFARKSAFREYFDNIAIAVLLALFLRSFVFEAFKIPSTSMVPTLLVGDQLFVNKFIYGVRIPTPFIGGNIKFFHESLLPERGDIVVFVYPGDDPMNAGKDFIKRVVGLPGDEIEIRVKDVYVNGVQQQTQAMGEHIHEGYEGKQYSRDMFWECLGGKLSAQASVPEPVCEGGVLHQICRNPSIPGADILNFPYAKTTVPAGHVFVMGDNRDDSSDSREWGFVPLTHIKGKAMFIWLSLRYDFSPRFERMFKGVK
ncbi:MAG: hypothetical protein GMKNLPBB_02616 [Myxococcota bacterium]|nr:hypothetical protein [Myxococcota bacterium]